MIIDFLENFYSIELILYTSFMTEKEYGLYIEKSGLMFLLNRSWNITGIVQKQFFFKCQETWTISVFYGDVYCRQRKKMRQTIQGRSKNIY